MLTKQENPKYFMDSNSLVASPPYNLLNFFNFSSLPNWSASAILVNRLDYRDNFKFVKIGKLIHRVKDSIKIQDDKEYQRVTIRVQGRGVTERDREIGKNIGTKNQFRVSAGQFIMSKIDARNGAFGIVPKELEGAAVTQDFLTYSFNKDLLVPEFFVLLTTTKRFYDLCQRASSGTTNRQRIDEQLFLNFEIPVPSLVEQMKLVEAYNNKIRISDGQLSKTLDLDNEIRNIIISDLQINLSNIQKEKSFAKLQIVNYSSFERWDVWNLKQTISSKYPIIRFENVIKEINTGTTPSTSNALYFGNEIPFYTPSDLGQTVFLNIAERGLSYKAMEDKKARIFLKNTLLFVGIGSTIGKVGIIQNEYASANQQITGIYLNENKVIPEFVFWFFETFKELTTQEYTKATLPIVNQEKIKNIPLPLPSLEVQQYIVNKINNLVLLKKYYSEQSLLNQNEALETFENALFNTKL